MKKAALAVVAGILLAVPGAASAVESPSADIRPKDAISAIRGEFDLGPSGVYTVATSFAPLFALSGGAHGVVFAYGSGWFDGLRMSILPRRGRYSVGIEISQPKQTSSDDQVLGLFTGGTLFAAGEAVSFVATWDGRAVRLFVNGKEVASCVHARSFVHPKNRRLEFGNGGWGLPYHPIQPFRARVWRRALTGAEVASIAAEDLKSAPKGLCTVTSSAALQKVLEKVTAGAEARAMIEERLAFACLAEKKLENAEGYFKKTLERKGRSQYAYDARLEFRERWADALAAAGYHERAAVLRAQVRQDAPAALKAPYVQPEVWTPSEPESKPGKPGKVYYIASDGADDNDGSLEHPFATVDRAQRAIRQLKTNGQYPNGGVTVFIRGGRYPMAAGLVFDERDSGEPGSPVTWRACRKEKPVFDGGWRVPELKPVTDQSVLARIPAAARGHVRCCDVRAAGYGHCEAPNPYGAGCGSISRPITDLYADGAWLVPARHPNDAFLRATEGAPGTFAGDVKGLAPFAQEHDLMACGFWRHLWLDMTLAIESVDPDTGRMTVGGPSKPDLSKAGGKPYFLCNALCAIDSPGEWYLDSVSGVLYVWPPEGCRELVLSDFSETFLQAKDLHDVRFGGLTFEHGRLDAVDMRDCRNVRFSKNIVRNFGRHGVSATRARNVRIVGNEIVGFGARGVFVTGGDRRTLTPAENVISDNEIAFVERRVRTYSPGLGLDGCGMDVIRNRFHDMPSSAMRIEGNDYRVFSNLVERVVTESDDQGGIDIYRDPSYAGVLISYNTFRDIGTPDGADDIAPCGQAAVRFDGNISGMTVYSNRFERCGHSGFGAVQINGGRNNIVEGNMFVDCTRAITISSYPPKKWLAVMDEFRDLYEKNVDIHSPPYSTKYPGIATLDTQTNQVNMVLRNTAVRTDVLVATRSPDVLVYGNRTCTKDE